MRTRMSYRLRAVTLTALFMLALSMVATAAAARGRLDGWVQQGGTQIRNSGIFAIYHNGVAQTNPYVMQNYPQATVTVYISGTSTLASIYSDSAGTAKVNPFVADVNGYWWFWGEDGVYDVAFSGAISYTRPALVVNNGSGTLSSLKNDWRSVTDASIGGGSTSLSSATAAFTAADVGKLVKVKGAGVAGIDYVTTIDSIQNSTTALLTLAATTGVVNAIAVWASDNSAALQAAIDASRTDTGGSGMAEVIVPAGYYMISSGLSINTDYNKVHFHGVGQFQTVIEHVGAAGNGALYVSGTTCCTPVLSDNNSWVEIDNLSIGSMNGHGLNFVGAGMNSRIHDMWVFEAGLASYALIRIQTVAVMDFRDIRLGSGDMSGYAPSTFKPYTAMTMGNNPYRAVWATNYANAGQIQELHFRRVELHFHVSDWGMVFETTAAGAAMADISLTDCPIKTSVVEGSPGSILIDGANVRLTNTFFEDTGSGGVFPAAVKVMGTNQLASVFIADTIGNNGDITIDQSNNGVLVYMTNTWWHKANLIGTPGSYLFSSINGSFITVPTPGLIIRGSENTYGTTSPSIIAASPTFQLDPSGGATSAIAFFPFFSNNASGGALIFRKYRGTPIAVLDIQSGDVLSEWDFTGNVTSAMRNGGSMRVETTGLSGTNISSKIVLSPANAGTTLDTLSVNADRSITVSSGGVTQATLPASANGSVIYCSDCKNVVDNAAVAGAACVSGGNGAIAKRQNNHWDCN